MREYVYIRFMPSRESVQASSVDAAKAYVRKRFPKAHFANWEIGPISINMPVWENIASRLRYELGETEDRYRPVAYVCAQDWAWKVEFEQVGEEK